MNLLESTSFVSPVYLPATPSSDTRNRLGGVYTPAALAEWVAREFCRYLPETEIVRVLDPACGNGSLLKAVAKVMGDQVELIGTDLDEDALAQALQGLPINTSFYKTDALAPKGELSSVKGWRNLTGRKKITGIIANPPWGAEISHSNSELKALGYKLASGQFDSYDLFVELCLSIAPKNSVLAFILPDSIFNPEHEGLRRLILNSTQILSISRLGEGFFPGVFRGTVVVIARKKKVDTGHTIDCMRLNKEWRQKILTGHATFEQAKKELAHPVLQSRLLKNAQARFDIDVREDEEKVLVKMSEIHNSWSEWLASGRGIELSKYGNVINCPECKTSYPLPRQQNLRYLCRACNGLFDTEMAERKCIVRTLQKKEDKWQSLIVGEDVNRYKCFPSRQVHLDVEGINYKTNGEFAHRKLLIRKTGLGIKAAIDETGAYTNQVVYHYYLRPGVAAPSFLLNYFQGVLCSRVLLAYYLKRIGENEWRSHPYVTQRIVAELPIPNIKEGTQKWRQASAIADAVEHRKNVQSNDSKEDLDVERLVAGLYGLTQDECNWVLDVLEQAEALEPIRTLRITAREKLMPVIVN